MRLYEPFTIWINMMEINAHKVPEGWQNDSVGHLIVEQRKSPIKVSDATCYGSYPFFTSGEDVLTHVEALVQGENIYMATGGQANIKHYSGDAAYSTDTYVVKTTDAIDAKLLYYYLTNIRYYIDSNYFQGSGLKHLQKKDLKKHELCFPKDKNEQKRIAALLAQVDNAIAETKALIEKYSKIKTGLMQDLLTKGIDENGCIRSEKTHKFKDSELGRIPEEWNVVPLGKIIKNNMGFVQTGPFGSQLHANEYIKEGCAVVMPQDIHNREVVFDSIAYISEEKKNELNRHVLQENDVIIPRRGDLSKCAIWHEKRDGICGTGCILIRLPLQDYYSDFFSLLYEDERVQKIIDIIAVGTTMKNLNSTIINSIPFIEVNKEEQKRILNEINNINNQIDSLSKKLLKSKSIREGLLLDLLSGKVRIPSTVKI